MGGDQMDLLDLEARIKELPGVLGCVILSNESGGPLEIQAFARVGADRAGIRERIQAEAQEFDFGHSLKQVLVFELEAESLTGPDTLKQAELLAELEALNEEIPTSVDRPRNAVDPDADRVEFRRVVALSTTWHSEAEVSLRGPAGEIVGQAVGEETPHGLEVLAQATIDAVHKLIGEDNVFQLAGSWLTEGLGRQIVLVVVNSSEGEMVGAALVRDAPMSEAAVRATLDAVNRRLARLA
jgi:hypothetical protein